VVRIREQRDLRTPEEDAIREVNAGAYLALRGPLHRALSGLRCDNAQGEFYLTDAVESLALEGPVVTVRAERELLAGVNTRTELSAAEAALHARMARRWAEEGCTIVGRPLIDEPVELSPDVIVEDGVRLRGTTRVGPGTKLDVGVVVDDSTLGANVHVKPYCVITQSEVGDSAQLGPFAHLRPGSVLEAESHVGNFVETKNTRVRRGAKANHLAYLGDGDVGEGANLGAGVIFCNYDGYRKQRTVIGARAFVGSDSQLIAPVTVGEDAYIGTGTTVTRDVPPKALALGRVRQVNKEGYGETLRARLAAAAAESRKGK
jgi:bifunctional UDP-N-acetylglucosamine pyrophosphorylase/glucosamine-1-phosphate N-acetyltransferase